MSDTQQPTTNDLRAAAVAAYAEWLISPSSESYRASVEARDAFWERFSAARPYLTPERRQERFERVLNGSVMNHLATMVAELRDGRIPQGPADELPVAFCMEDLANPA